jgi:cyclohexadienyl dehydratase
MRFRHFPLVAAMALAVLTGCSAPSPSAEQKNPSSATASSDPASRLDEVLQSGTLQVCSTGDYRPFTYRDPETGEWSGIDITMVEDLAARMDVEIEYVQTTWADLMPDFLKKCDIAVGGISISMERAAQAFYTDPIWTGGKTPITRCENVEKYDTIEEINQPGVRSITPIGGTNEIFAEEHYPKGEIVRHENNNTIFGEIIAGRVDVMTTDASETMWVANKHPELCAVHPNDPFNFSQKGYLLPRSDEAFQEYVNQWLNMARNDGTYAAAKKPWIG